MYPQKNVKPQKRKYLTHIRCNLIKIFKTSRKSIGLSLLFAFIGFIALNFISSKLFFRIDATEESLYTLSDGTKSIIKEIDELTTVKLFFSKDNKDIPQVYIPVREKSG